MPNGECGGFIELKDPAKARGFLRVKVNVNTANPLINGYWLKGETNKDTWVEFRYERLQDFCYRCGRISHANTECFFAPNRRGATGYGEWLKAGPIRDEVEIRRPMPLGIREKRKAGAVRDDPTSSSHGSLTGTGLGGQRDFRSIATDIEPRETPLPNHHGRKKWHRRSRTMVGTRNFTQEWIVPARGR
ncbi:hypothetical protein ACFX2A_015816 [Malus domestica]